MDNDSNIWVTSEIYPSQINTQFNIDPANHYWDDAITKLSKDLDYLYKHCIFALIRVRDYNDYKFLSSSIKVLSEISEGWERVTLAITKSQGN